MSNDQSDFWKRKLAAYLHDPPEKVLDLAWHKERAKAYEAGLPLDDARFSHDCDHTAAASDRLPWPRWQFLESTFDGRENRFKHPLGGASFEIAPYSTADVAHYTASINQPKLTQGDERAQFLAIWRLWRWWASDNQDFRLAFLPADTRLPDHTIWTHNSIVSALQACVTGAGREARCRPAFLLFQMGPVQDYIAQARRTLDLWSGSYLLSYLIGAGLKYIALNYGPDNVIFPNLCGQPIFDLLLKKDIWNEARVQLPSSGSHATLWDSFGYDSDYGRRRLLTPSLPNRFLAVLPEDMATDVAREVEQAIREAHGKIAEEVWKWAAKNLKSASCWTHTNRARFDAQNQRFLDVAWQVLPWPKSPDEAYELTGILPDSGKHESDEGPRGGLRTVLEMARRMPPGLTKHLVPPGSDDHRDVRNFDCARHPEGTCNAQGRNISGWKDRSKLQPDAKLDNPGAAWSALYQLVSWQLDAVRQTRAWQAWSAGGWETGREFNKDSLNGKEEALLVVGSTEEAATALNKEARIEHLFKPGELLGASSLIKRLWPTAWLQPQHELDRGDFSTPDTRSIAAGQPFEKSEEQRDVERLSDEDPGSHDPRKPKPKYFAVLALDGDELGKWVSGLHREVPRLKDQLSPGALAYFREHLPALLDRKRPLNPSFHLQLSEMLANFGNFCVRRIVEAHDGRLIYSGGDDVLALLPAQSALDCAKALRAAFRGAPDLSALTGAWRVSRSGAEKDAQVRLFAVSQPGFIQLEEDLRRNGFALEGEPVKFPAMVPGPAADCSVGIAIAHFKSPLQDVVRAAQAAEKRAKKQLGRSAVAVTLMKRSGEIIEWGCKWQSGGLDIYHAVMQAMATGAVSSKFPHRVAELLDGYLTETSPLAARSLESLNDFPVVDVALREFCHALQRQGQDKNSAEYASLVEITQDGASGKALLQAYLTRVRQEAETKLKRAQEDANQWSSLGPEAQRRLENGPVESPLQALIGLCQTVAFAHRTRSETTSES